MTEPKIGPGAVLYDTRKPQQRKCCSEGGRCLWHVTSVYRVTESDKLLYEVWDGTHTVREWMREEDFAWAFEPAGWQWPTSRKPTYHLTRDVGVHDNHDLMLEENRR